MKEKRVDEAEDQMSKLPEPILHHFTGLLLAKDAGQISTLSKTCSFDSLPEELFVAKGLNILNLRGFKLELPPDHGIKFSSLRKLRLTDTYLDEQHIQPLCASCIGLENLRLCCRRLASLQIAETEDDLANLPS
ncbi:hypothetical protein T459_24279 [Capsicum annuum]|uniref:F-box/LRR-repeat protein 15/At3g58940/PEG3-like LRR domain-containing protein n=1 Tax=Capsicum annuum TaxID=4072 RepID=A0A2G2YUW4_CAPAN|nr:hypothetical protein T459_24279 [Capsicum annuum]